jgi:nucleoside-diphosphate-sugar epimerase
MKKKILITGGAGYIGSILTPRLLEKKYEVTVLDNFLYNQSSLNHLCGYKNFEIIKGDVRDNNILKKCIENNEIIVPLAAIVGAPACKIDPVGSSSINKDAIFEVLRLATKDKIIIMPTTNSAYGSGGKDNMCDENSPLNPISTYAVDKLEVEKKLMSCDNFISLRLATVFGMSPRMRVDLLVNDFVHRAFRDKFIVLFESHFKRNFIHVEDVASVFLHSIENFETMKNQIYNVGMSDANLSKKELCDLIKKVIPDFNIIENNFTKDEDQRNYIVSNKKIEATGFKPKKTLQDGINELIKGYTCIKKNEYGNI